VASHYSRLPPDIPGTPPATTAGFIHWQQALDLIS
jgi:hypothetical protein